MVDRFWQRKSWKISLYTGVLKSHIVDCSRGYSQALFIFELASR